MRRCWWWATPNLRCSRGSLYVIGSALYSVRGESASISWLTTDRGGTSIAPCATAQSPAVQNWRTGWQLLISHATSALSRPVFTDTASTNCCLVIRSSVPTIARYRSPRITSNRLLATMHLSSASRPTPIDGPARRGFSRNVFGHPHVCSPLHPSKACYGTRPKRDRRLRITRGLGPQWKPSHF